MEHLEQTIIFEGPKTIGAILIESVVGTNGILVPPKGYLEGVRALCDKYGIIWIADEVMAGFGRTGKWFAYQHSTCTWATIETHTHTHTHAQRTTDADIERPTDRQESFQKLEEYLLRPHP